LPAKPSTGPVLFPLLLVIVGIVLLLNNFLLLEFLDVIALWPISLVIIGATILLRGDLTLDDSARTFGVTRGSVEAAVVEISSAEIDVSIRDLERPERLIAGKYAANTRPHLDVNGSYAHVRLDRATTPWFNTTDWELALAQGLPWQLFISSHLGAVDLDLTHLIIEGGVVATGLADIRCVCPQETLTPLTLRSTFGNIQLITPLGAKTRVRVEGNRLLTVRVDERRYATAEPHLYIARNPQPDAPLVDLTLRGTFGDVYLA
jgi:hypothetical protein